jgi:nicotinamidase-related amidase
MIASRHRERKEAIVDIQCSNAAVVFIDPQNDVLSECGKSWGAVGASVTENRTVEHMGRLFKAAKAHKYEVFIFAALFLFDRMPA